MQREARAGEIVTIRTLISHEMESGQRRDAAGAVIPRRIINAFAAAFEGERVFACAVEPSISANPYFEFKVRATRSGTFRFTWTDDNGSVYTHDERITVT
jgi:sulfur-oxidizing protein SoxZ